MSFLQLLQGGRSQIKTFKEADIYSKLLLLKDGIRFKFSSFMFVIFEICQLKKKNVFSVLLLISYVQWSIKNLLIYDLGFTEYSTIQHKPNLKHLGNAI